MNNQLLTFILDHEEFRKARLPSLYSDFTTLKISNPDGFAANVSAWKNVLGQAALKGYGGHSPTGGDVLTLQLEPDFVRSLATREWGMPSALPAVVDEAINARQFIPLKSYLAQQESIYHKRWVDPWQILSWTMRQMGLSSGSAGASKKLSTEKLVVVKNVEEIGRCVIRHMSSRPRKIDRIISLERLPQDVAEILQSQNRPQQEPTTLSDVDMDILVKYITRDLNEATSNSTTIKFKQPSDPAPQPITEEDITIANLKNTITSLTIYTQTLSSKIAVYTTRAKTAITSPNNNRALALSALRSKKLTEDALTRSSDQVVQLENVLMQIEQASDNAEIVKTLERSSKVLEKLNKEVGGIDKVEEMMDTLQERMEEVDMISNAVGQTGATQTVDDEEVTEELEAMVRVEEEKKRREREAVEEKAERVKEGEDKMLEEMLSGLDNLKVDDGDVKERVGIVVDEQSQKQKMDKSEPVEMVRTEMDVGETKTAKEDETESETEKREAIPAS